MRQKKWNTNVLSRKKRKEEIAMLHGQSKQSTAHLSSANNFWRKKNIETMREQEREKSAPFKTVIQHRTIHLGFVFSLTIYRGKVIGLLLWLLLLLVSVLLLPLLLLLLVAVCLRCVRLVARSMFNRKFGWRSSPSLARFTLSISPVTGMNACLCCVLVQWPQVKNFISSITTVSKQCFCELCVGACEPDGYQ